MVFDSPMRRIYIDDNGLITDEILYGLKARLYGKLNSDKIEALSGGNLGVLLV